jgi:catechol 2,3-dioxygenase-like lactoylglutathione lyase family enzyme
MTAIDYDRIEAERARIRAEHLRPHRPASSARGAHHIALVCSNVEHTVRFYQDLLEFPLTEIVESRDTVGRSQLFFDIGNGNLLAFVDLPGRDLGAYEEILGGLHHLAISVQPQRWQRLRDKLDAAEIEYDVERGVSLNVRDPDGARLELIAEPLGHMYGVAVA